MRTTWNVSIFAVYDNASLVCPQTTPVSSLECDPKQKTRNRDKPFRPNDEYIASTDSQQCTQFRSMESPSVSGFSHQRCKANAECFDRWARECSLLNNTINNVRAMISHRCNLQATASVYVYVLYKLPCGDTEVEHDTCSRNKHILWEIDTFATAIITGRKDWPFTTLVFLFTNDKGRLVYDEIIHYNVRNVYLS